ncbi:hypothetical protein EJB05_20926, partial [Eragrostis curvula]
MVVVTSSIIIIPAFEVLVIAVPCAELPPCQAPSSALPCRQHTQCRACGREGETPEQLVAFVFVFVCAIVRSCHATARTSRLAALLLGLAIKEPLCTYVHHFFSLFWCCCCHLYSSCSGLGSQQRSPASFIHGRDH